MENLKEVVLYSENFKAQDNLLLFAKELGFNNIKDIKCRMDKKFIKFIKEHFKNTNKKFDLNGSVYIKSVDINKKWTIMHDSRRNINTNGAFENIAYLNMYHQENNFAEIQLV